MVLRILKKVYKVRLASILTTENIEALFLNLSEIYATHKIFLANLEKMMESKSGRILSVVVEGVLEKIYEQCTCLNYDGNSGATKCRFFNHTLLTLSPVYLDTKFCVNVNYAMELFGRLQEHGAVQEILRACKEESSQRFELNDLLKVPFQRVCKYPLLISELQHKSPDVHPDKVALTSTVEIFEDLLKEIDATKAEHDRFSPILSVPGSPPLASLGRLVLEGEVGYVTEKTGLASKLATLGRPKIERVQLFLFQTTLIVCRFQKTQMATASKSLKYLTSVSLLKPARFDDILPGNIPSVCGANNDYTSGWRLKQASGDTCVFVAGAVETRNWRKEILSILNASGSAADSTTVKPARTRWEVFNELLFTSPF